MSVRVASLATSRAEPQVAIATALVTGLTLACNLALFWREIVSAVTFGAGAALDGFIIASLLPLFVAGLMAGALAPALAPPFAAYRQTHGAEAARVMLASIHLRILIGGAALSIAMWYFAGPVVAPLCRGADGAARDQIVGLYRVLVPVVLLQASSAVWRTVLNLERRLVLPALTPALAPLLTVALLASGLREHGVAVLAWGQLAGAALELLVLALTARGSHAWSSHIFATRPMPGVFRSYATLIGAAAFSTSAWLVDNAMAASLSAGSVAALGFGGKAVSFFIGVIAIGISTTVLPTGSQLVARREWVRLRRLAIRFGAVLLLASLPVTVVVCIWSEELTAALYQRGAFDAGDARLVSAVQSALVVQLPFHVLGVLCVRLLSALQMNRHVLLISASGTLLNVVLNLALMPGWGVVGIAMATTSMFVVTALLSAWTLMKHLGLRINDETGQMCT